MEKGQEKGKSPQGQPGSFPIERQDLIDVIPLHCAASSFPYIPAAPVSKKNPAAVLKLPGRYGIQEIR